VTVLLAFTVEHAARATGVSERRIRYWDRTGVLSPSILNDAGAHHAYNRIYSFRDLVGLKALGQLRDRFDLPLQRLRAVGAYLKERYDAPWSELKFSVLGRGRFAEILFRDSETGVMESASRPGQTVLFEVEPVAREVERDVRQLNQRSPDQYGVVTQNRYVLSNKPVLAGTRIPTAAVWEFHEAGYTDEQIIRKYPRLTLLDVHRAIDFESEQRRAKAS
jgi:uncharacterized protein (DUF433 family)